MKLQLTDVAKSRLEALVKTTDGFELAEVDLELRGEGQLLGTRQSGWSDLRFTKLRVDRDLIERAGRSPTSFATRTGRGRTPPTASARSRPPEGAPPGEEWAPRGRTRREARDRVGGQTQRHGSNGHLVGVRPNGMARTGTAVGGRANDHRSIPIDRGPRPMRNSPLSRH